MIAALLIFAAGVAWVAVLYLSVASETAKEPSRPPFIETASGRSFKPLDPDPNEIDIEDIAHALSHQCRYSGHTRTHYSVAEHCVRVSDLLAELGCPREVLLWGLLHDASEAYLVDIPSPLKTTSLFAGYRVAEWTLMKAICERFGLSEEEPPVVRVADLTLLSTEVRDLMPARAEHWGSLTHAPLPEQIRPWGPEEARRRFLERFESLTTKEAA